LEFARACVQHHCPIGARAAAAALKTAAAAKNLVGAAILRALETAARIRALSAQFARAALVVQKIWRGRRARAVAATKVRLVR
jgi:hypothetical protein